MLMELDCSEAAASSSICLCVYTTVVFLCQRAGGPDLGLGNPQWVTGERHEYAACATALGQGLKRALSLV